MEFSYKICEAEYLSAAKLKIKGSLRLGRIKKVGISWSFIVVCLLLFFLFSQHSQQHQVISDDAAIQSTALYQKINWILSNFLPFIIIIGIFAYGIFRSVPMQLRRLYRKDPLMQGQFTVNLSQESISIQNTAGSFSKTGWNLYDYWREGKNLIMLVFHTGAFFLISTADLSDAQRDELRSILTVGFQKK